MRSYFHSNHHITSSEEKHITWMYEGGLLGSRLYRLQSEEWNDFHIGKGLHLQYTVQIRYVTLRLAEWKSFRSTSWMKITLVSIRSGALSCNHMNAMPFVPNLVRSADEYCVEARETWNHSVPIAQVYCISSLYKLKSIKGWNGSMKFFHSPC